MAKSRGRSGRSGRATKDRVLQARIPENLDEELRGRAEQLGLSVSSIVRNVLLNTFDLVEGVVSDSAQLAQVVQGRESRTAAPPPATATDTPGSPGVVGWQEAVLNQNGVCEQCNAILARGEQAAVGIPVQVRPVLLCLDCLAALSPGEQSSAPSAGQRQKPGSRTKPTRRRKKPEK
jgi:hypothetical protein